MKKILFYLLQAAALVTGYTIMSNYGVPLFTQLTVAILFLIAFSLPYPSKKKTKGAN